MPATLTAAALDRRRIAEIAGPATRHAALQLARFGRIQVIGATPRELRVAVRDQRRQTLYPTFCVDDAQQVGWTCTCGRATPESPCPCVVAATRSAIAYLVSHPPQTWETRLDSLIEQCAPPPKRVRIVQMLLFTLVHTSWQWQVGVVAVSLDALPPDLDRRDPAALEAAVNALRKPPGVPRDLTPERFPDADAASLDAARLILSQSNYYGYYGGRTLSALLLDRTLSQLGGAPLFLLQDTAPHYRALTLHTDDAALLLHTEQDDAPDANLVLSSILQMPDGSQVRPTRSQVVSEAPTWLLVDERTLIRLPEPNPGPLLQLGESPLTIPAAERDAFLSGYLTRLADRLPLTGALKIEETLDGVAPEPRIYLSERQGALHVALRFGYGDFELAPERTPTDQGVAAHPKTGALTRIHRDVAEETRWEAQVATEYRLKRGDTPGAYLLRAHTSALDFVLESLPRLAADGFTVFGEESLTQVRVNRSRPTLNWSVSSGIDWFDVDAVATFGDTTASFKELRRAIRNRERFVRLADGTLGAIPDEWVARLRLTLGIGEETKEGMRLSPLHAALLEETVRSLDGDLAADAEFARRRDALRAFEAIVPEPVPDGFVGTLRPYQKAGYDWLRFLRRYGFGGCLADDMGTGKTIQALALLLSVRGERPRPSLLVVPRSLIVNWEREAARFAPDLRLLRHDGNHRNRRGISFDDYDVVITTYGVLLRDIEMLRAQRFQYAILDEAQAIKNPLAHTSRAVRLLRAEHRLTLTGTPVENAITELWSQFAFLNPGLLGGLDAFRENFGTGVGAPDDAPSAELATLRGLTRPFLLRRTKERVAPELPPRTERLHLCEFEAAQRKLYEHTRDRYRAEILGLMDESRAPGKTQMTILEGLLRLRQICCDPRLVEPDTKAASAKLTAVTEMMETLRSEGSKALVFSQFVQLLSLLRRELDTLGLPYVYLDGRTRDRQARVDAFQTDPEVTFFLISLKAGGTGLNLTAADHVIHLDPWWNPAVEQQATDRAHRIGQDKPVFVTRFVVQNSVEEKILTLQDKKRALVKQLIADEEGFFKSLTRKDIEALFA